jgi:subtilisin family serine protease
MVPTDPSWRRRVRRAAPALTLLASALACCTVTTASAQGFMHTPSLSLGPRVPTISATVTPHVSPTVTPHVNPSIASKASAFSARTAVRPVLPYLRTSTNLYPGCTAAERSADGECLDDQVSTADGGGGPVVRKKNASMRRNANLTAAANLRTIANELVAEIDGALSDVQADELARRHRLVRVESQNFPLLGATIGLFRISDRRPLETASREFAADVSVHSVQPNFRYLLQEQKAALSEGDPAQYALAKLRLPQAHTLARGADVRIAVIDSGIDISHPELAGSIVDTVDVLGGGGGPHVHGTGIAGAIASHARLMGSAPAARILAIRAFGVASGTAESNSFVVLKGLDYAAAHEARIVNMSFAGPKDPLIERGIAAMAARNIVMVAAAGNAGAKSPPLYPAANADVIAVSATDAQDRLFSASNRGSYVSVAAPGVDIFLPAPDGKYQMTSGTSFSAAYVSGLAALMLERNPALKPQELRAILMKTARDLGSPGRDDQFGAGEADAFAAVEAASSGPSVPAAGGPESSKAEKALEGKETPLVRAIVSDKSATDEAIRPAAQ